MDFGEQIKKFWQDIGIFTKVIFIVNLASFTVQNAVDRLYYKRDPFFEKIALCPTGVLDENQWYRFLTSEITHGSVGHILTNMCMFLVWGTNLEKHYGTIFYAFLNVWISILSNLMSLGVILIQTYWVPSVLHGGYKNLQTCAVGYSNILFGIMMLEAFIEKESKSTKIFGMLEVKRIYVPWIMMVIIQLAVPDASLIGHLTGIVSALLIKYSGVGFLFMPRYSWINSFEDVYPITRFTYYKATQNQVDDFKVSFKKKGGADPVSQFDVETSQEISQLRLESI